MTISLGVATFPDDGEEADELSIKTETLPLALFEAVDSLDADTLTFADVIAGSNGQGVSASKGLAQILNPPRDAQALPQEVRESRYALLTASVVAVHGALLAHGALSRPGTA